MSTTFAPVYVQHEYASNRQNARHVVVADTQEQSSGSDDEVTTRPLTRLDPYHVAGWSREKPLPSYPFPHAAREKKSPAEEPTGSQLLDLKPPLLAHDVHQKNVITNRTHLDNLTALLHRCISEADWKRAQRCVGLILRSEYKGVGTDLRHNGNWMLAAEVLMRSHDNQDEGLQAVRRYYERLILQYPYTMRTERSFNATDVYPALFNTWIFEVQARSKVARSRSTSRRSSTSTVQSETEDRNDLEIRKQELKEAATIADRLNQLLMMPPYDTDARLLSTEQAVTAWINDIREILTSLASHAPVDNQSNVGDNSEDDFHDSPVD